MKTAIRLLLLLFLASNAAVSGGELKEELIYGDPISDREKAWQGHVSYASWLDDKQIVFWSSKGGLVCLSLESKSPAWTLKTPTDVRHWSVSRKSELIAYQTSGDPFAELVTVIDGKSGKVVFEADRKKLARIVKTNFVVASTLGLSPAGERLLLIESSGKFDRSGFAFDPRKPDKVTTFQVDPSIRELNISLDGKRIAYIAEGRHDGESESQVIAVRSIDSDQDIFLQGKRVLEVPKINFGSIDTPFYSHIRHDGKNLLVYSRDNSWGKGIIFVRNLATGNEKFFDGRNGHIVFDVRFDLKRIALSGTSTDVTVLDFDGKVVAEKKHATADRNAWIEFSPAGDRLLAGSWDNTVRVLRIEE